MAENLLGDNVRVLQHVVIPKPQYADSHRIESQGPSLVVLGLNLIRMLPAVEFHGQPTRRAIEVQNIPTDWMLAAEPVTGEALESKNVPKLCFGVGRLLAHCPGKLEPASVVVVRHLHGIDRRRNNRHRSRPPP